MEINQEIINKFEMVKNYANSLFKDYSTEIKIWQDNHFQIEAFCSYGKVGEVSRMTLIYDSNTKSFLKIVEKMEEAQSTEIISMETQVITLFVK